MAKPKIKKKKVAFSPAQGINIAGWVFIALFLVLNVILAITIRPMFRMNRERSTGRPGPLERYTVREQSELEMIYGFRRAAKEVIEQ